MLDKFHDIIKSDFAHPSDIDFLLAVSGGRDSMVLATCFLKLGIKFEILHCHFGLRSEAYKETQLVLKWCATHHIKARIAYFPTPYLPRRKGGSQALCRDLRYQWFDEVKSQYARGVLVTAHHSDDEKETFFINLIRGSGITGLSGMKSDTHQVYRPLLTFTQNQISHFAEVEEIPFIHDTSNFSNDYLRNSLRNNVIPKLNELNRNATKGIDKSLVNLKETASFIEDQLTHYVTKYVSHHEVGLNIGCISDWPPFLLKTYLSRLGFSSDIITEMFKGPQRSGRIFDSKNYQLLTIKDGFYLVENRDYETCFEIFRYGQYELDDRRLLNVSSTQLPKQIKSLDVASEIVVDAERLSFPLRLRNWRDGDKMKPLGMEGRSKKVQDILTDAKINKLDKKRALVAEDSQGRIFWLIGHHISHDVRITGDSETFLSMSLKRIST